MTSNNPALQIQKMKTVNDLLNARGPRMEHAGINNGDSAIERYAYPSSKHPNLMIVNPITDDDENIIMPGYYELVLTADRQMLILAQAGKEVATLPVFKIEEDRTQEQMAQPMDNKSQRKADKEKRREDKKRQKLYKQGKIESLEPEVYMNATIQYETKGDYYLVKYECGKIRAWGAIK